MRRREFIAGLGGVAAAWPLAAWGQQSDRLRRIGVLSPYEESDPVANAWISAFTKGLSDLGWTDGGNLRMDIRWVAGNVDRARTYAKELVNLQPDVILADSTPQTAALQHETRTIPILFVVVSDPVGSGFVEGLPRPGGNITGFMPWEPSMAGKWLELLTKIAPGTKRVAALFNPDSAPYVASFYLPAFEAAARSFNIEPIAAPVRSDAEIETIITALGRGPRGGFVAMPDAFVNNHRGRIILLAAENKVPAVYQTPVLASEGGLLSYGPDIGDIYYRAASYADRILRGAKPADLPVQMPVKFEMAVNLKTAKAIGVEVPPGVLALADEVID